MNRKNKDIRETLDNMREEAMNDEDYNTVRILNDIQSEIESKLLRERLKGILGGYGTAMAGVAVGLAVVNKIKSKND